MSFPCVVAAIENYRNPFALSAVISVSVVYFLVSSRRRRVRAKIQRLEKDAAQLRNEIRGMQMQTVALDQSAMVSATDASGRIVYANDAFCQTCGYSRAEVIGQSHRLIKSDAHSREFFRDMWQTITSGSVWRGEVKNRKRDGSFFWANATIVPFEATSDAPYRYVAIRVDITARKQLEGQLALAQRLESMGRLAAGVAHEINTPAQYIGDNVRFLKASVGELAPLLAKGAELAERVAAGASVTGLANELRTAFATADVDDLIDETQSAISQTIEGVERVSKIVQAMKEYSHPGEAGMSDIDLNHLIESTITVASSEWRYVAEMATDLDPELPLVSCYPAEFNQVVLNVIVNAAHAIADVGGGGLGKITVSTRRDGEAAEVRIADTGPGIPMNARSRIFDPFFTTKELGRGTGQGLSLAYNVIVQKHGGSLQFETETGQGTTFIIRLPLVQESADLQAEAA